MSGSDLLAAAVAVTKVVPSAVVEELARLAEMTPDGGHSYRLVKGMVQHPALPAAERVAKEWRQEPGVTGRELAAMLRAASTRGDADASERIEVVMTGPSAPEAPTRATEVVVLDLVRQARRRLLLVTYAATPYSPLLAALKEASDRGVVLRIVVETEEGAQGLLTGEPATAFASIPGVHLLYWPLAERPGPPYGRLHAKVAVADERVAFVTSANLTGSALAKNLECGLLVHGGSAPRRIWGHFAALQQAGVVLPLPS